MRYLKFLRTIILASVVIWIFQMTTGCSGERTEVHHQGTFEEGTASAMNSQTDPSALPEIACSKIPRDLSLSGKMEDPLWKEAEPHQLLDAITGRKEHFATEVRVLFNETYLYVGFRCEDDYVWGSITDRDGPIYNEECVEVFISPAGVTHQYYEINVSPKNIVFDACILNGRTAENPRNRFIGFHDFNLIELQTQVHVDGEPDVPGKAHGWTAEFAIPLTELWGALHIPPKNGDIWRINFYRIDSPRKGQSDYFSWSTVHEANFHQPWKFGCLRFRSSDE